MTPNVWTGPATAAPSVPPETLAALTEAQRHAMVDGFGYATVLIGSRQQAQGPVMRRHRDGRVTIDAGGRIIMGHPSDGAAPRGWRARIAVLTV